MTDVLSTELVEASRRVIESELPAPSGFDTQPHAERWSDIRKHLEALGWFDLLGPPERGGLGLSPALVAPLLRLAGSSLLPGPVVEAVLAVPWLLSQSGVRAGVLDDPGLAVCMVDLGGDLPGRAPLALREGRVRGRVPFVLGALDADVMLVHVMDDGTERLLVVPSTHPGVQVEPLRAADPCQSVGSLVLDCALSDEHLIGSRDDALPARLRAWRRVGSAAYLAGISERVLALGVEHALQREQFGRRIGSFQAIQHMLSDVAVIARSLHNLIDFAAEELVAADAREAVMLGATTKARASHEAVVACETVLQVLGGMGFTVEHPLHHYLKRALSLAAHDGSPGELNVLVGRLVLAQRSSTLLTGSGGHGVL